MNYIIVLFFLILSSAASTHADRGVSTISDGSFFCTEGNKDHCWAYISAVHSASMSMAWEYKEYSPILVNIASCYTKYKAQTAKPDVDYLDQYDPDKGYLLWFNLEHWFETMGFRRLVDIFKTPNKHIAVMNLYKSTIADWKVKNCI